MKAILPINDPAHPDEDRLSGLHGALELLWDVKDSTVSTPDDLDGFKKEKTTHVYGPITRGVVKGFRDAQKLESGENVDGATAARLNELLLGQRKLAKIVGALRDVSKPATGNPPMRPKLDHPGLIVRALHDDEPWADVAITGADDAFVLYLDLAEPEEERKPQRPKVRVFYRENNIAETAVQADVFTPNAALVLRLDIDVNPALLAPYEFSSVRDLVLKGLKVLKPFEPGKEDEAIARLRPDDVANLETLADMPPQERIEHLAIAHLLASDAGKQNKTTKKSVNPDAALIYGLLRLQKLLYVLWRIPPQAQVSLKFESLAGPPPKAPKDKGDPSDDNQPARLQLLAQLVFYSEFVGKESYGKSPEGELVGAIRDVVKAGVVENRYLDPPLAVMNDTLAQGLADLRASFVTQQPALVPAQPFHNNVDGEWCFCRDGTKNSADLVLQRLLDSEKLPKPYADVARLVADGQKPDAPQDSPLKEFRLGSGNVYHLAAAMKWKTETTDALLSLQRVVLLTEDPAEVAFLLGPDPDGEWDKLDGAWKIRMVAGLSRFTRAYVALLGRKEDDQALLAQKAEALFDSASARSDATAHAFGEARALATAQHVDALTTKADRAKIQAQVSTVLAGGDKVTAIPSWERLFGSLDACACDECDSIYGPASYLVDVLQYFKRLDASASSGDSKNGAGNGKLAGLPPCLSAQGAKTVFDVLMSRRSDIGYLDLNCANAMTEVPYIDLVNELLEDRVSPPVKKYYVKLEPGPIPGTVLNELLTDGFHEVTEKAEVTADSKDNRLVRDERALILFERIADDQKAGCPAWLVRQLRQTFGTAAEIAAAPEYVNQGAVEKLKGKECHFALALPFDADRMEAAAYLSRMETDRTIAMRAFAKWSELGGEDYRIKVATEALGLTSVEVALITEPKPDPNGQHEFWAEEPTTLVKNMSQLRRFLDKTGLKTEPVGKGELDELLVGKYINLIIEPDEPDNPAARCDTEKMHIKELDAPALDRINRFLRLRRKLGWRIDLLDRLIRSPAVGNGEITSGCIVALGDIIRLARELDMEPEKIAAWFVDLSVFGEPSDYRRIFLQKGEDGSPYPPFLLQNLSPPGDDKPTGKKTIADHAEAVARALGVTAEQLATWLAYCGSEPGTDKLPVKLSLRNLSRIWAWFRLAKKLGLSMRNLTLLLAMRGMKDALESPAVTRELWEIVTLLKAQRIGVADIRFWLLHRTENGGEAAKRVIPDLAIVWLLAKVRVEFMKLAATRLASEIVEWKSEKQPGDAMETCLQKLQSVLARVKELSPDHVQQIATLVQNRAKTSDVETLQALLKGKPLGEIPGVGDLADGAPVNAPGSWIETTEDPAKKISHREYQTWTRKLVSAVLDRLDALARQETVVRIASQELRAPVEQISAILPGCRMPKDGQPANGAPLLDILTAPDWAVDPRPLNPSSEAAKAAVALFDAAFCSTDECVLALEDRPRRFRHAVLADTKIDAWTDPLTAAEVEGWRTLLSPLFTAVRLAHKVAGLAKALRLQTDEQLIWGLWRDPKKPAEGNRFHRLDWFSPDEMPLAPPSDSSELVPTFAKWLVFLRGLDFIAKYPQTETPSDPNVKLGGSTAFELALADAPTDAAGNKATGLDAIRDIVAICYQLFGSPEVDLFKVAEYLAPPRDAFKTAKTYARLERAAALIGKLGIAFSDLPALTAETVTRELALMLRQLLKHQSDDATWFDTLKEIQDPLRECKRDALVAYLIADPSHHCFREVNDLYDHFLIDPQMCACMPTSRIVQAHAVVQLFAQRCLMGQEPSVDPGADARTSQDWHEWTWMRNYRVWQANRKIFLYPENWIEPELRDDKSQFFKDFEQTLLQTEVNDSNVEIAARSYLDKLDDAAFMEVMAAHYQETPYEENGKREGRVLHIVARTKGGDPPTYFYRRFIDEQYWTSWEKIEVDIATDHVLLFVRNNRLNIAWPVFVDIVDESAQFKVTNLNDPNPQQLPKAPRGWTIQLAVSERSNGLWQPKRVSKEAIQTPKTEMVTATNVDMAAQRLRCRFVIRDREPRGYFLDTEGKADIGFFILAYSLVKKGENGELMPTGPNTEPILMGAFNLAGCRGYPELVSRESLAKIGAGAPLSVPRIRHSAFEMQRWIEQESDAENNFVIEGLLANNFSPTTVFDKTPGTFKATTVQQTTLVDNFLMDALKLAHQEPKEWQPNGIFVPFFYEDGRRGYVAVPSLRLMGGQEATISNLIPNLDALDGDLRDAASDKEMTWQKLIDKWTSDDAPKKTKDAFAELKKQLAGCFGLRFLAFYHPLVCLMKRSLAAGGFERLMGASPLEWQQRGHEFNDLFGPKDVVLKPHPAETVGFQFDRNDGYASYNWEVFYHLPSLVSQKLVLGQKFADALRWFHFVFNPSGIPEPPEGYGDATMPPAAKGPGRYWLTKPFRSRSDADTPLDRDSYVGQRIETILRLLGDPDHAGLGDEWIAEVRHWRQNPFVPHQVARGRTVAYQKATVMRYLDALIQWGDFLFRQDTRESVNAALQLYVTAERLLGPRPRIVKAPGSFHSRTFRELERVIIGERPDQEGIDPFGNSLIELENLLPPQPPTQQRPACMPPLPAGCLTTVPYFCIPRNEKLMGYWDTVADRLYKIRHCQNIEGIERRLALFAPPIDPGLLVRAVAAGLSIGEVLAQGAGEVPHYRFQTLAQKATELTQMVAGLGNALLQTIEKKDAEGLAQLRSNHEISLLKLVREIKLQAIQEADASLEGLNNAKATTEERRLFYSAIQNISGGEQSALDLNEEGARFETAALVFSTGANIAHMLPDFTIGAWGFGGAPGTDVKWGGINVGNALSAMGQFTGGMGGLKREAAAVVGTRAGYARRWDDWKLQERLANRELAQIVRQIDAAKIHLQMSKDELRDHDKQIEQAQEILAYLKDRKFSNQDLYDWMLGQISASYFQAWQLAYRFALRVERAFHFELGPHDRGEFDSYVRPDSWNSLHKGLLAADRLLFDLKRLEVDYMDRNRRELEITKHISLVRLAPTALRRLKEKGTCEIDIPDWLFDLDYPGHYFRRIKSVSLSLPCVAGPYASVNCTLTLTKSQIRKLPKRADDESDEDNLLRNFSSVQSIATSTGQNDSGLFEVNFRDERYLPFEGAGAISTWTLQLDRQDNLQLDFGTLTDVIMHLKYTARRASKQFETTRRDEMKNYLKGDSNPITHRLFVIKDEFPAEWHRFTVTQDAKRVLTLDGLADRLPYFSMPIGQPAEVQLVRLDSLKPIEPAFEFAGGKPKEESSNTWVEAEWGKWDFTWTGTDKQLPLGLLVSFPLVSNG